MTLLDDRDLGKIAVHVEPHEASHPDLPFADDGRRSGG